LLRPADAALAPPEPQAPPPPAREEIFVRAIDLPTLSLRQAKAAVTHQLDILSPLPPADVAASVVLLGPTEEGLNRFAVGIAPRRLLARPADGGARTITLTGRLDGQDIRFRFERADARAAQPVSWLEVATLAGMCVAIVLAGANLRVDREIDAVQASADDANQLVQRLTHDAASVSQVGAAWRAAQASRKADVVDCALGDLAKAAGGPVKLSRLTLAGGELTVRLAAQPTDAMAAPLRALGFAPVAAAPAPDPAAPPPPPTLDFRTSAAECR
jgi:hypothetical protein